MENFKYLIIGGGMTAAAAMRGIRELDQQGSIGVVGLESDPPYKRPPLSKGLWKGKPLDSIWLKTEDLQAELRLGRKIVSLDPGSLTVQDEQGTSYKGEKILLATGGTPRRLPFGGDQIIYYRTLADYKRLAELSQGNMTFAVIGGGFIGSEITAALAMNGRQVTMLFPEDGIGAAIYPHDLALFLNDYFVKKGVSVWPGEVLSGAKASQGKVALQTKNGRELIVDAVIAGIGIQPNVEPAKSAGLQVGNGILVDRTLAASYPGIFAAGDAAEFFNPALNKRMRVEHEDNANTMGRQAGRNMAGASELYDHLSYFYSDIFELGYEAVGELDPRQETFVDWKEPFNKGVVYYMAGGKVRGVLLWNVWDTVPAARALIAETGPFTAADLKNRLG
ncbi:MAG: FAD-dependent oxidoreductase [Anaerolineales bacterium]|jgi:NADPH-dependent 2,4-dienoyl-CoA reductase/sulfur reductase-like enzyme